MEAIIILVIIRQTQPLNQNVYPSVHVMGIVEQPLIQQSILITNTNN